MKYINMSLVTLLLSILGCSQKKDYQFEILEQSSTGNIKTYYVQVTANVYTDSAIKTMVNEFVSKNGDCRAIFYSTRESYDLDKFREKQFQPANYNFDIESLQNAEEIWYKENMPILCKGAIAVHQFKPNETLIYPYKYLNGSKYCK